MSKRSRGPKRWTRKGSARRAAGREHEFIGQLADLVLDCADAMGKSMTKGEAMRRARKGARDFDRAMLVGGPVPPLVSLSGS